MPEREQCPKCGSWDVSVITIVDALGTWREYDCSKCEWSQSVNLTPEIELVPPESYDDDPYVYGEGYNGLEPERNSTNG